MHKPYVVLDKKLGETPLAAIDTWRAAHPEYRNMPATYAGRLDPMAEGKLLILLGEECRQQDRYRSLDKEYEIEVLLDLSTDTGDVLGMPSLGNSCTDPAAKDVLRALSTQVGTHDVPYPAFSSKTVSGKPLFQYALEGTLGSITIPTHPETVHRITLLSHARMPKDALSERMRDALAHVPRTDSPAKRLGEDFRQDAVRAVWEEIFNMMPDREFSVLRLRVICASGTYMRTLADRIGTSLGTQGIALSIRRTRIGKYLSVGPLGLWYRTY